MLQNARLTAFTVSELVRENQLGEGVKLPPPPHPRLGLILRFSIHWNKIYVINISVYIYVFFVLFGVT